ncbi:hypothetical protein A3849_26380 [Paenibacillus sp. P46E]|nr:hypothetical protein A3849_26380 [Paenibacillus sp. P46E]
MGMKLIYLHDWADTDNGICFCMSVTGAHRLAILQKIDVRFEEVEAFCAPYESSNRHWRGLSRIPPLYANFEEGPVGKFIADYAL